MVILSFALLRFFSSFFFHILILLFKPFDASIASTIFGFKPLLFLFSSSDRSKCTWWCSNLLLHVRVCRSLLLLIRRNFVVSFIRLHSFSVVAMNAVRHKSEIFLKPRKWRKAKKNCDNSSGKTKNDDEQASSIGRRTSRFETCSFMHNWSNKPAQHTLAYVFCRIL